MTTMQLRLEDDPRCHRCTGPAVLLARIPRQLSGGKDSPDGHRTIGLCQTCDRDDPDAQGLLAFFTFHETITDDTMVTVARLIDEWTTRAAATIADPRRRDVDACAEYGEQADWADYEDYLRCREAER